MTKLPSGTTRRAWHFTGSTLRDGRPIPPIGTVLRHEGPVVLCSSGLYASVEPFDALRYARGPILHSVECAEVVDKQQDKFVCRARTIVASKDMTAQLRRFACDEALRILPADAPDIVREYLVSADKSLRQAARKAAWDAAQVAAWDAARKAAWDAAREAAWEAAREAAWDVAWEAAWAVAREAAWEAAWAAARDAERAAAREAARDAAREAALEAAWDAARGRFNAMVYQEFT